MKAIGRDPTVALQEAAASLFTSNVTQTDRIWRTSADLAFLARWFHDKIVVKSLMWTFKVVVFLELYAKHMHVRVSENDERVQAFLLNRLDVSLDDGNCIERSNPTWMRGLRRARAF